MTRWLHVVLILVAFAAPGRTESTEPPERKAIARAIPLLECASAGSAEQRTCFTCHSQALPVLALSEAGRRGFDIDAANFQRQLEHTFAHLDRNRKKYLDGKGTGGKADTAGYAMWTLAAGDWPQDETTAAVAEYLLLWQADQEHWSCTSNRPPSEASDFATTYLSLRGIKSYGTDEQQERITARFDSAREWLMNTSPEDNEDRVFRLRALSLVEADPEILNEAKSELLDHQQQDGGWSQLDDGTSDPYATATALVALHDAGGLEPEERAYRRGIEFLLSTQREDGSWHVVSRSDPFQEYFETGFPHDTDQFISTAATGWAVMALLYTQPYVESETDESRPDD